MIIFKSLKKLDLTQATAFILRKTVLVGAIILLAKLLFVCRDLIVAWRFGRSEFFEAFILAFLIPFTFSQTLSNSLTIAFIPKLIKLREDKNFADARQLYESLFVLLLGLAFLGTLFCAAAYPLYYWLITSKFSPSINQFLQLLLYLTAPAAFFYTISNLWRELLNAEGKFLEGSAVSIITPLLSIIFLVYSQNTGVVALSVGLFVGGFIEMVILGICLKSAGDFKIFPRFQFDTLEFSNIIKSWWRLFISNGLNNSVGLVDGVMAVRYLEAGGLAALSYGKKIVTLPMDIATISFSTVLIPHLSELAAKNDWTEFKKTLNRWLIIIFLFTFPAVLIICYLATGIIELVFERGAFTNQDTKIVSVILVYYVFQLPFYVMYFLMLRVLPIINKTTVTIFFSILAIILTALLNLLFIKFFGTAGIALSSSCVYFILALSLCLFINFQSKKLLKDGLSNRVFFK